MTGNRFRQYTPADVEHYYRLRRQGVAQTAIAERMGRGVRGLQQWVAAGCPIKGSATDPGSDLDQKRAAISAVAGSQLLAEKLAALAAKSPPAPERTFAFNPVRMSPPPALHGSANS